MMIKLSHTHDDGKTCYSVSPRITKAGIAHFISWTGGYHTEKYGIGYMPYTGSYYAYDLKTGKEVARFSREFYDSVVKQNVGVDLAEDPDCVI